MNRRRLAVMLVGLISTAVIARAAAPAATPTPTGKELYVYADKLRKEINRYVPSGWMGDTGDLRFEEVPSGEKQGSTAQKITYSAKGSKGAGWAGVYWQNPNNNWGSRPGGFNLSKFKKLTFKAKGAIGGERISDFKMGGIQGDYGDTDSASTGPIELTKEWKTYTIDLADKDLSRIIGGFCFAANRDDNPNGFVMFLNDIRYE